MQYLFVTALPKYFSRLIAYVYDYGRDMVSSAALIHFILAENRVFFFTLYGIRFLPCTLTPHAQIKSWHVPFSLNPF